MTQTFPPIESKRLHLIPMTTEFLQASLAADQGRASELLGVPVPAEWFDKQRLIEMRLGQLAENPALSEWLLRAIVAPEAGGMVGYIGFHTAPAPDYLAPFAPLGAEIGYTIFVPFRRRGYATEACAALMHWAAATHGVPQFVLTISPTNVPSLRIAEQFGFRKVGSHIDEVDGPEDIFVQDAAKLPR